MLTFNPQSRINCQNILRHPFFLINSFSDRQVDEEQRIIQDSHTASRHISQAPLMLSKDEASSGEDLMKLVMEEIADFAA